MGVWRFNGCVVNPASRELLRNGKGAKLEPKAFEALVLLLERRGKVVTREEFRQRLWPGTYVELDDSLHAAILKIRQALGKEFVHTVPKVGYRIHPRFAVEWVEELPDSPPAPERSVPVRRRRRWRPAAAMLLAAALGLAAWRAASRPRPEFHRIEGDTLSVYDAGARKLWSRVLPALSATEGKDGARISLYVDLDGDRRNEFLFAYYTQDLEVKGHLLRCFRPSGEFWWAHRPGRAIVTPLGRKVDATYYIRFLGALSKPRPDGGRIVVGASHNQTWAFQVALLTADGRRVGEYWHPGWLWALHVADIDGDGAEEILLGGVNNSYGEILEEGRAYGATLVVLDADQMDGHGRILPGDDRIPADAQAAHEKAVLLFRAPEPVANSQDFFRIRRVWRNAALNVMVEAGNNHTLVNFTLDRSLRVVDIQPELNLEARILSELPPGTAKARRLEHVRERLAHVKYLVNRLQ